MRNADKTTSRAYTTDPTGIATIELSANGTWLIRAVHMERCDRACEGADWQSYWAAMTFAIK
ncbi:MAG: hypothetical protein C4325_13940 [Blastocatellia bacterium]